LQDEHKKRRGKGAQSAWQISASHNGELQTSKVPIALPSANPTQMECDGSKALYFTNSQAKLLISP